MGRSNVKRFVTFSLVQLSVSFLFQAEDSVKNFFPDRVFELDKLLKVKVTFVCPGYLSNE